jgi:hypothetical protein
MEINMTRTNKILCVAGVAIVAAFGAGVGTRFIPAPEQTPIEVSKKDTAKAIADAEKAASAADIAAASARKAADSTKETAASAEQSASDTAESAKAAEQFVNKVK